MRDMSALFGTLKSCERGLKEPGATILFRIAKLYGKSIEWLLMGRDGKGRYLAE
jgi:hypothetical protein